MATSAGMTRRWPQQCGWRVAAPTPAPRSLAPLPPPRAGSKGGGSCTDNHVSASGEGEVSWPRAMERKLPHDAWPATARAIRAVRGGCRATLSPLPCTIRVRRGDGGAPPRLVKLLPRGVMPLPLQNPNPR
jgi:hypothetical protein